MSSRGTVVAAPGWSDEDLAGYEALDSGVAAHRRPREVLRVGGPDAEEYLQGQCSQDLAALGPGTSAEALLLGPEGKVVALLRVTRRPEDFLLDVDAGCAETVGERLRRFKLRSKVEIEALPWRCVALRGRTVSVEQPDLVAVPAVDVGAPGVDILGAIPEQAVPDGVRWATDRAWEARRVEAGWPVMGREIDERTIPAEAGLLERAVSFTKGCYTGQELVARLDARGNKVARRLLGLVLNGGEEGGLPSARTGESGELAGAELRPLPDGAAGEAPHPGGPAAVTEGGEPAPVRGSVTSSSWSPAARRTLALAYVHRSLGPGDAVVIDVAGGPVTARIAELPFDLPSL